MDHDRVTPRTRGRRRRLQHDQRFDRLRSLPARRRLVVVSYAVWIGFAILWWSGSWEESLAARAAAAPLAASGVACSFLLTRVVRRTAEASDAALDERLVAVRDASYRTAYSLVGGVGLAALFIANLATGDSTAVVIRQEHLLALLWAFLGAFTLTPSAVLAWREREI